MHTSMENGFLAIEIVQRNIVVDINLGNGEQILLILKVFYTITSINVHQNELEVQEEEKVEVGG